MPPSQPLLPLSYTSSTSVDYLRVSQSEFLSTRPRIRHLMVGAIVFRENPSQDTPNRTEVLLIRRAASDSYPGQWEVPGGKIDDEDATVLAGAVRELWEETGLRASHVLSPVGISKDGCTEVTEGEAAELDDDGFTTTFLESGSVWGKCNVVVEVEDTTNIIIDPMEHSEWVWVSEEEVRAGVMKTRDGDAKTFRLVSEGVRWNILDGFRLRKQMQSN